MMNESEEKDNIKKMAKLRATIEKRVEALETELDEMKTLLTLIDSTLLKEGFKRAEISSPPQTQTKQPAPQAPVTKKKGIPLKTVTGDLLAEIYTEKDSMQIVLAQDKNFDVNIPPFTSFFVERVLAKMQEKDKEDADKGKLSPDRILDYAIKRDGNKIVEIDLQNLRHTRFRELKSSIRWTLEKMFEKMQQNN
jgi:hypothetical protein